MQTTLIRLSVSLSFFISLPMFLLFFDVSYFPSFIYLFISKPVCPQPSRAASLGSGCLHASWPEDITTGTVDQCDSVTAAMMTIPTPRC